MAGRRGPKGKTPEQLSRELFEDRLLDCLETIGLALQGIREQLEWIAEDTYKRRING